MKELEITPSPDTPSDRSLKYPVLHVRPGTDQRVLSPLLDCARAPNQCNRKEEEINFIVIGKEK